MPIPRAQDVLFAVLGVVVIALLAFDFRIIVLALLGAFACGSLYVFAGMIPARTEGFWHRIFISVFLTIVMSSIVLILPGTLGLQGPHPDLRRTVVAIAGTLPLAAIAFEIVRTPRVIQGILRCLGYR